MNIVIVEDEPQIREGLVNEITRQTTHTVIGTAIDGIEGIQLIKVKKPDLVITDIRMPNMSGLDMLQRLSEDGLRVHAVVLTGFADFEYAQTAISLEVLEYVLKPVDVEQFIETLSQLEKRLVKKRQELVSVEQLILSMLVSDGEAYKHLSEQIFSRLRIDPSVLVDLFLIRPVGANREYYAGIQYLLKRKLSMMFIENFHVFNLPSEYGILIVIVDVNENQDLKYTFNNHIISDLFTITNCLCGYIRLNEGQDMGNAIDQLNGLFQYAFYLDTNRLLTKDYVDEIIYEDILYPIKLEKQLIDQIRNRDIEGTGQTCQAFIKHIIESRGQQKDIKDYTVKFAGAFFETVQKYGLMEKGDNSIQYYFKLMLDSQTKEELAGYFNKAVHSFSEEGREIIHTENLIVLKVIAYIRNNYKNDITLTDAAEHVGISPIYLSKLFTQEVNINFVAFLRDYRISAAKRMLSMNKYKVGEIAEKVGFNDPKYFNKVFKSVCGISPSEYKRQGE